MSDPHRLIELASKCDPGIAETVKPLTRQERREIAAVLFALADKELTQKVPNHRPREGQDRKFFCVLRMVLDIDRDVPEDSARAAACREWGLTVRQMKEAVKMYRKDAEDIAAKNTSPKGLMKVCEYHRDKK